MSKASRIARQRSAAREKELILLSQLIERDDIIAELKIQIVNQQQEIRDLKYEVARYKTRKQK